VFQHSVYVYTSLHLQTALHVGVVSAVASANTFSDEVVMFV
jgi:hypothetical protein